MPDPSGTNEDTADLAVINLLTRYFIPTMVTITAMCFMAAASASIGVWKDVSVMRESLGILVKNAEAQKKVAEDIKEQVHDHEIRLSKGGL